MNIRHRSPRLTLGLLVLGLLATGCDDRSSSKDDGSISSKRHTTLVKPEETKKPSIWPSRAASAVALKDAASLEKPADAPASALRVEMEEENEVPPEKDPPLPDALKPLNKQKTLFFEKTADGQRRVWILAEVCRREGPMEVFFCKLNTKEHESILHADLDARDIHTALIAAGARPGSTVKFVPVYKPATGDVIKVMVTYHLNGKLLTKPAQSWVQNVRTKKAMEHNWVFAGSRIFKDPDDPQRPPYYCANNGEVISLANFADSMMDLPVKSSDQEAELDFVGYTERIPPLKTKVLVMLEPAKGG